MSKYSQKILVIFCVAFFFIFFAAVVLANPDQTNSTFFATEVPADGVTQSVITITLNDATGSAVVGDTVQIANSTDATIVISPASVITDSSGIATFSATSTTAGTDPIDVTDITTSTTFSAFGNVIFDPLAVPTDTPTPTVVPTDTPVPSGTSGSGSCSSTAPTDAPNLYQITPNGTSVTLYFAPPTSTFDGFTISYGLDTNADTYNATFSQGSTGGAVSYTINALSPNTLYYFKVRANNGCANGPWSTAVSATSSSGAPSSSSGSTPVTGSTATALLGISGLLMSLGGFKMFHKFR